MIRKKISSLLVGLVLFIFIANLGAMKFHWYYSLFWLDMLMHFLGGFWVALLAVFIFPPKEISWKTSLQILGFTLLIGVLWEFFEISLNSFTVKDEFDMIDTLSDIFFDMFGALSALGYLYFSFFPKNNLAK